MADEQRVRARAVTIGNRNAFRVGSMSYREWLAGQALVGGVREEHVAGCVEAVLQGLALGELRRAPGGESE